MKSRLLLGRRAGGDGLVAELHLTLVTPWTVACQAPLSMGFSRQEYWSGLPFPSPGDLPDPGVKPGSPALQADSLLTKLWGKQSYDKPKQHIRKQWHHFADKDLYSQSYGFSRSYVWIRELDHNEGWTPKIWFFWITVLEKILERPLDCKEIKPVNPIGNQPWIFIGRTDVEAPILWTPNVKSWLFGKDPHAGKDWRQKEKRVAEDEIVR